MMARPRLGIVQIREHPVEVIAGGVNLMGTNAAPSRPHRESSMRSKSTIAFRPVVELAESRILAAVAAHGVGVSAASAPRPQAWVEIVNRTNHAVTFELSANAGSSFHTYHLRAHASAYYHADHADSDILIREGNAPITSLAASPTRQGAFAYSILPNNSITPGRDLAGRGLGGTASAVTNVARFSILNQTSRASGPGGVAVTIQFSVDGGKTYPLQDVVPYTGGLVPRHEMIYYGNQGILYKLPANPSIRPTPLTSLGQYTLFSNPSFQPYLFPTS